MKRNVLLTLVVVCIALFFAVCGDKTEETRIPEASEEAQAEQPTAYKTAETAKEGEAVAREILETFDKAVSEVAELVKDKPGATEVKPKIETLLKKYEEIMTRLNVKYLALKKKDIRLFGEANSYLGEYRGKHVFKKNQALDQYIYHYKTQKGEEEIAQMISKDIVKLLDVAVKR
jgi:hypothetical protein